MESAIAGSATSSVLSSDPPPVFALDVGGYTDRRRLWYVYRIFNLYRLMVVGVLLAIFFLDGADRFVGVHDPALFKWTALIYVGIVLISIRGSYQRRPALLVQSHFQTVVDIVGLSLLIHASGGPSSSLSILLVTAVAASSILLPLFSALLTAFAALTFVLGDWLYLSWEPFTTLVGSGQVTPERIKEFLGYLHLQSNEVGHVTALGASFVIAALLTHTLAERARHGEELARKRTLELLEVADLNQAIVRHLQSGIIVVDRVSRVRLMNETACDLLNYRKPAAKVPLEEISPILSQRLATWLSTGMHNPKPFRPDEHLPDISPKFSTLIGGKGGSDTLVFLEDSAQVAQQLQHIKLAALGRLTAGIAHEIRNPLASISHAAQLLSESPATSVGDRRLKQIIHDNAKRASRIITNVMELSRRDRAKPEDIALKPWLEEFCREFMRGYGTPLPQIEIRIDPEELAVRFDTSHLHQIVWNLCTNACSHGTPPGRTPRIRLAAQMDELQSRPFLDIIDFGPGIPQAEARKMFEPFFTTQPRGTGLGLYISREICEANRSQLQYVRQSDGGSCFRITFANPSKQDVTAKWNFAKP